MIRFALAAFALCALPALAQPTYSRDVSRIMQSKCMTCHRPNDIAPFAFTNYEDARIWAPDIKRVVEARYMPPWKPVEGHGKFRGNRALTTEERQTILDWIEAGAPEGDPAELPEPLPERGEWSLGDPDLIVEMPEPYTPPLGRDMYRCFVLPTGLTEDRFVAAADVLPGSRAMVHHVLLYLDVTGEAEKLDAADPAPGYTCYGGPGISLTSGGGASGLSSLLGIGSNLGGWAPGQRAEELPDGIGMFLDRRARIVMQVHYYTSRGSKEDRTRVGLYFSKKPVERRLLFVPVVPTDSRGRVSMEIPANAENHQVTARFSIPPLPIFDVTAINVYPHMHLLGRKIEVEVTRPGQSPDSVMFIDDWDFNWQGPYSYTEPQKIPAGSSVKVTCTYDNSVNNPRNPNVEPKLVRWGEGTEDEMCLAFVGIIFDRENLLPLNVSGRRK